MTSSPPLFIPSLSDRRRQIHGHHVKTSLSGANPSGISAKIVRSCSPYTRPRDGSHLAAPLHTRSHGGGHSSFTYNTLIRTHAQNHEPEKALSLFYLMVCESPSVRTDNFTFPPVLKSCAQLSALEEGEQAHSLIVKTQCASVDLFVQNSLIHMYARCGKVEVARKVFDTMASRNVVTWNSMIDGYAKSGDIDSARWVFENMHERNIVSWNSMISGYVQNYMFIEALNLFVELQILGLKPDESTLLSICPSVSDMGCLRYAKRLHGYLKRCGFSLSGILGVAVIDMYSKCGSIHAALEVFEEIPCKDVGHWTSMIVGLGNHGFAEYALQLFEEMQDCGVPPNYVTFVGLLTACSHGGLVEEGLKHFRLMRRVYGIVPGIEHYGCLVDLLGRLGHIDEAKMIIENMPMQAGVVIWSSLLAACRNHGNIETAEFAAQKLIELEPSYEGCYVLLSDLYARVGKWEDFCRMRKIMDEKGIKRSPGFSWIEVGGEVHQFVVGDKFHPQSGEISHILQELEQQSGGLDLDERSFTRNLCTE